MYEDSILEAQMRIEEQLKQRAMALVDKWYDMGYIGPVVEAIDELGFENKDSRLYNVAICLENVASHYAKMIGWSGSELVLEAVTSAQVDAFIKANLGMISAVMPSLIVNELVLVQALTAKKGDVFYIDTVSGVDKGAIRKGDVIYGHRRTGNIDVSLSGPFVEGEVLAVGDGTTTAFTGTLEYHPLDKKPSVFPENVIFTDGTQILVDANGDGNLEGDGTGTVDYTTGAYTLNFAAAPANGVNITAKYLIDYEAHPEFIPMLEVRIGSYEVEAITHKLRTNIVYDATFATAVHHGISLVDLLQEQSTMAIKNEIDTLILNDMYNKATGGVVQWSAAAPSGVSDVDHWKSLSRQIDYACDKIFQNTRFARGNWIVAGVNLANYIRNQEGFVAKGSLEANGPHYIGDLNGIRVYVNPFFNQNIGLVGHKGKGDWGTAAYAYCPFMPLYKVKPVMLDDFISRQGAMTMYGKREINTDMFVRFEVV